MPKPVKKKKKFISKKQATTYRLIPGYVEDEDGNLETPEQTEARHEIQRQHGIFYTDSYNYTKHLRTMTEEATMVNVSAANNDDTMSSFGGSVCFKEFFSTDETEEEKIDPEILSALENAAEVKTGELMDDGEVAMGDEEPFLNDDFVNRAGGQVVKEETDFTDGSDEEFNLDKDDLESNSEEEDMEHRHSSDDEEENDDWASLDEIQRHPARSRGNAQDDIIEAQTALILRNFQEGLGFSCAAQHLDEAGDRPAPENFEGLKNMIRLDKLKDRQVTWSEVLDDHADRAKYDLSMYEAEDEVEYEWTEMPPSKPKFDCTSILSLKSNTRNLPTDIIPPRPEKQKNRKASESDHTASKVQGMTAREVEEELRESRKADRVSTFRPTDETMEEKRSRKKAIKEERKERRMEKKANKNVFSIEKEKMHKEVAALSKSGNGIKLS